MNALAKHLAAGLDVRCSTLVFAIRPGEASAWSVGLDDGTGIAADAIVLTCPLPQSFSLLITAGVELPPDLRMTDYDRTLALLAVLDRPPPSPRRAASRTPTRRSASSGTTRPRASPPFRP